MAFLRHGEYATIKERCDLIRQVQALWPKPSHWESKKIWNNWLIQQNIAQNMSKEQLVRTLQRHATGLSVNREERRAERRKKYL